jgi:hypothetical protein
VPTRRQLAIVASVLGLVAVNLVVLTAFLWAMEESIVGAQWFDQVGIGLLLGQITLIGVWFGLGDRRWYMRLPVAVALVITTARCLGWAGLLSKSSHRSPNADQAMVIAFILLAMMLATALTAFILRRMRGWRLTWDTTTVASPMRQFQIADAMLWMLLVSGAFGAMKFLHTIDSEIGGPYLDLAMYVAESTALVLLAVLAAFARRWSLKASAAAACAVVMIGAAGGIPDTWRHLDRWIRTATAPVPAMRLAESICRHVFEHGCGALSSFVATLLNCLVLRWLGCKLVRPGRQEPMAEAEAAADAVVAR